MTICTTIGIVSTKGGVGKTSTSAALAAILADMGQRVLMIDGDFQQSLSDYYRLSTIAEDGLLELITRADPTGCISKTVIQNLDVVVSNDPKRQLESWVVESVMNAHYLKGAILKLHDDYDFIIIDSQGSENRLLQPIILASDIVVSPVVPNALDVQEFGRGTVRLMRSMEPKEIAPAIPAIDIPPMYGLISKQERTADANFFADRLRRKYNNPEYPRISILDTYIPHLSSYAKSAARHIPVHQLEAARKGPSQSAYQVYLSLIQELFPHLAGITPAMQPPMSFDEASVVRVVK